MLTVSLDGALDDRSLRLLGLHGFQPAAEGAVEAGLAHEPKCHPPEGIRHDHEIGVRVSRGTSTGVFLTVHPTHLRGRHYQVIRVIERSGDAVLGGITYVAVHRRGAEEGEAP